MLCRCGKLIVNVMPNLHGWARWECKDCAYIERQKGLIADKDWNRSLKKQTGARND